jgi:hypothetical protein
MLALREWVTCTRGASLSLTSDCGYRRGRRAPLSQLPSEEPTVHRSSIYSASRSSKWTLLWLGFLLSSCRPPERAKEQMFTLEGHGLSDTSIMVNGEPAIGGRRIRFFILPGMNTLSVEGKKGNNAEYRYALFRGISEDTLLGEKLLWSMEGKGAKSFESVSGEFRFDVQGGRQWEWAKADVVDELTKADRDSLSALYVRLCNLFQERGTCFADIVNNGSVVLLDYDREFLSAYYSVHDKGLSFLWKQDQEHLEHWQANPDDLVFDLGRKIVFARNREAQYCLFLLELNEEESRKAGESFGIKINWLHFARFGGEWKILLGLD